MKKKNNEYVYIKPEPITFVLGLGLWAFSVFTFFDWRESIISAIILLLYGHSISYGSKNYKEYYKEELKQKIGGEND